MLRSSLAVSLIAMFSSGISFVNQLVLARLFGTGSEMDAYLIAMSLPVTVASLVVGALGYQLVPALQLARVQQGSDTGLLRALVLGGGACTLVLSGVCACSAGALIKLLNPDLPEKQRVLATNLSAIGWSSLPFSCLGAVYGACLHVRSRFLMATLFNAIPMLGSLILCLLLHSSMGVCAIAWGQLLGYAVMAMGLRLSLGRLEACEPYWFGLRRLGAELPSAVAALLLFVIYPFSDAFWGSRIGPASVSYLGYAQRILVGFSGLAVVGATTVLFPRFAKYAAQGDHASLRRNLDLSLRAMLVFMAPAAAVLGMLSLPIVRVLFARGAFSDADAQALAGLLPVMFTGMVAMSLMGLAFKALFAQKRVRAAAVLSVAGAAAYFVLSWLGVTLLGLIGIGVAYAITWWVILVIALGTLGLDIPTLGRLVLKLIYIGSGCAAAAWAGQQLCSINDTGGQLKQILCLVGGGVGAVFIYCFMVFIWPGVDELQAIVKRQGRNLLG